MEIPKKMNFKDNKFGNNQTVIKRGKQVYQKSKPFCKIRANQYEKY